MSDTSIDDSERTVAPENYSLWDDEEKEYRCPFCDSRMLRVGNYAECTDCGERFSRSQDTDTDTEK